MKNTKFNTKKPDASRPTTKTTASLVRGPEEIKQNHISRMGKENLTIKCLPALIEDKQLLGEVDKLIKNAEEKTKFCKNWRHKHLAHRDLDRAVNKNTEPLSMTSREKVNLALGSLEKILNSISEHYCNSAVAFHSGMTDGALDLLYVLHGGLRMKEMIRSNYKLAEHNLDI